MYLQVNTRRSSLKPGSHPKLSPHYCGPFEVLERIRPIAYRTSLPVDHASLLNKYVYAPTHFIYWKMIQVELKGEFLIEPI